MNNLNELINDYGKRTAELTAEKKVVDALNKEIKTIMKSNNLLDFKTDKYRAIYQIRRTESMDEEAIIALLANTPYANDIIKQRPYVDEEALENAIYTGKLPADILLKLVDCRVIKETVALTVKEVR